MLSELLLLYSVHKMWQCFGQFEWTSSRFPEKSGEIFLKKTSFFLVAEMYIRIHNAGNGGELKLIQSVVPVVTKYLDNFI